jgi:cyclophilin family peptidyl-prolyl cis-trans isomerase/HEAT repeat protein
LKTLKLLPALILFLVSCSDKDAKNHDNKTINENIYTNTTLQEISNFQNDRNTTELLPYLESSKALYRETAALAFASLQDKAALNDLFLLLEEDKSEKVRLAAAFAIGQIGDSLAQNPLIKLLEKEQSEKVKAGIAEAIGKCGNDNGLDFLIKRLNTPNLSVNEQKAMLSGISRFSLRGIFSDEALETVLQIVINENTDQEARFQATVSLTRLKDYNLNAYSEKLIETFNKSEHLFTQLNLISALSNNNSQATLTFLKDVLSKEFDYRLKVNAIRALTKFDYKNASELVFEALNETNVNVAVQASEYFLSNGKQYDVTNYIKKAKEPNNWRVKADLLAAALKFTNQKQTVSKLIIDIYSKSSNIYEKANLLAALGSDVNSYKFVSQQVHESEELVIGTYGMMALAEMRKNKDFDSINAISLRAKGNDLNEEFAFIFKDAVISGDIAKVTIAAGVIRDPELNFRKLYENTYFLTQAMNNCKLPADMEAYIELQKAIAFIDGKEEPPMQKMEKKKIDWTYISKLPFNQQVKIITSKGDIFLELYVNQTPVSVANFLTLAEKDYFDGKIIHRVVPNFVVQDGCPRGDGWGGPDYAICSEFALNYYTEGSLGMASAGKDTESSQWFITHSPTPHLDGRYTNFGKVVKGMEVVYQLEVGDKIIDVEVVR